MDQFGKVSQDGMEHAESTAAAAHDLSEHSQNLLDTIRVLSSNEAGQDRIARH